MTSEPKQLDRPTIKGLGNGNATSNGKWLVFDILTTDDESHPYAAMAKNVGPLITFLAGLAQHAERNRMASEGNPKLTNVYEGPLIEAMDVGFAPGRSEHEVVLAFRVGDFGLGFAVETNKLGDLRAALDQMAPSAPHRRQ